MRNQIIVTITTCCVVSEHRDYQLHLQTFFFSPGREPISFELLSLAIIGFCHSQGAVLWQRGVCHSYDLLHGFRTQIFLVASSDNFFFFYLDENRSLELLSFAILCFCHSLGAVQQQRRVCGSSQKGDRNSTSAGTSENRCSSFGQKRGEAF